MQTIGLDQEVQLVCTSQDRGMGIRSVRDEGGQYGTVATYGSDVGGYEGWSIGGRVVFMHNMSSANGIYNDVNNEWHMLKLSKLLE